MNTMNKAKTRYLVLPIQQVLGASEVSHEMGIQIRGRDSHGNEEWFSSMKERIDREIANGDGKGIDLSDSIKIARVGESLATVGGNTTTAALCECLVGEDGALPDFSVIVSFIGNMSQAEAAKKCLVDNLHRHPSPLQKIAHALGILGGKASNEELGSLCGVKASSAATLKSQYLSLPKKVESELLSDKVSDSFALGIAKWAKKAEKLGIKANERAKAISEALDSGKLSSLPALPSGEKPSGEKPSGEKPSGEKPSGEKPSGEKPSGEKPSGEKPSGEKPSGDYQTVGWNEQGASKEDSELATFVANSLPAWVKGADSRALFQATLFSSLQLVKSGRAREDIGSILLEVARIVESD